MGKVSKFRKVLLWIGPILSRSSAVMLVVGTVFAIETATFVWRAQHATGSITRLDRRVAEDGSVNYAPVFTFAASVSSQYTARSIVANPPGFDVGESANILSVPSNPTGARIASFWRLWSICITLGFIGVIHGFISGCLTLFARRQSSPGAVPK